MRCTVIQWYTLWCSEMRMREMQRSCIQTLDCASLHCTQQRLHLVHHQSSLSFFMLCLAAPTQWGKLNSVHCYCLNMHYIWCVWWTRKGPPFSLGCLHIVMMVYLEYRSQRRRYMSFSCHRWQTNTKWATIKNCICHGQMVKWSNGQMVKWSDGQMVRWSDGQTNTIKTKC